MRFNTLSCLAALLAATNPASAWYLEVHNQIGYMTDYLLNSNAKWMINQILEPEYQGSIGRAAAWADTVSRTTAKYSYGWHWISAKDNPPNECGLYYHRDCQEGGCVVQQIMNQTRIFEGCVGRLKQGRYYRDQNCEMALKWMFHFVMDVCEPMHTSERAYGGNTFKVTFDGKETNLHQTWDRWILYSQTNHPNGFPNDTLTPYFSHLLQRINNDQFRVPRRDWAICDWDIHRGTYCPELWAKDSNALVCDYAYGRLPKGYDNGTDLLRDSDYARGGLHIVETQMAKAAWRLSGWLNTIASIHFGTTGMETDGGLPGKADAATIWNNDGWPSESESESEREQTVLGDLEL